MPNCLRRRDDGPDHADISGDGGARQTMVAEFDITPDLWFFVFSTSPATPLCRMPGADGLWQLTGPELGAAGRVRYALLAKWS
jgi:hypothetical protein